MCGMGKRLGGPGSGVWVEVWNAGPCSPLGRQSFQQWWMQKSMLISNSCGEELCNSCIAPCTVWALINPKWKDAEW